MKKQLLYAFVLITGSLSAQTYHHLLGKNNNSWSFVFNVLPVRTMAPTGGDVNPYSTGQFMDIVAIGDTTINKKLYHKVYEQYAPATVFGGLREDTTAKKVYYYDNYDGKEYLLYDFGLASGDSVQLSFKSQSNPGDLLQQGLYKVDSVVNIQTVFGNTRKFYLTNKLNPVNNATGHPHQLEWIEGIGYTGHPVYTHVPHYESFGFYSSCGKKELNAIICALRDSQKVYFDTCMYKVAKQYDLVQDSCHFDFPSSVNDVDVIADATIYPNPSSDNVTITFKLQQQQALDIYVADLTGRRIETITPLSVYTSGQQSIRYATSHLLQGIYLLNIVSKNGLKQTLLLTRM